MIAEMALGLHSIQEVFGSALRSHETLGNPQDVLFLLERLPGEMFAKGC